MKTIGEMREERGELIESSGRLLEKVEHEKREWTAVEVEEFNALHKTANILAAQIEREEKRGRVMRVRGGNLPECLEDLHRPERPRIGIIQYPDEGRSTGDRWVDQATGREVRVLGPKDSWRSVVRDEGEVSETILSLGRALRGIITSNWRGAENEKRALSSGGTAGFLLSPALSAMVIDFARAKSAVLSAGAQIVPVEGAELTLARIENDPVATWRPENVSLNEATVNFGAIRLKPKTLGALVKLPVELAEDASNLEPLIANALTAALGVALDAALLYGDGATQPKGLRNFISDPDQPIGTQDPAAALSDYDDFSLAQQAIKQANFKANAVILSPRSAGQLDRAKTGITNDLTPLTPPQSWAELEKFVTSQVLDTFSSTESDAFVGQFNQLLVGMRSQVVVEATRKAGESFEKLQVWVRAYLRTDCALARAGAFQIITGIEQ